MSDLFDNLDDPLASPAPEASLDAVHARAHGIRRQRHVRYAAVGSLATVLAVVLSVIAIGRGSGSGSELQSTSHGRRTTTTSSSSTTLPTTTTAGPGPRGLVNGTSPTTPTTTAPAGQPLPGATPAVPFSAVRLTLAVNPSAFRNSDDPTLTVTLENVGDQAFIFTPTAGCRSEVTFRDAAGKSVGYPLQPCLGLSGAISVPARGRITTTGTLSKWLPQLVTSKPAVGVSTMALSMFDTSLSSEQLHAAPITVTILGETTPTSSSSTTTTRPNASTTSTTSVPATSTT